MYPKFLKLVIAHTQARGLELISFLSTVLSAGALCGFLVAEIFTDRWLRLAESAAFRAEELSRKLVAPVTKCDYMLRAASLLSVMSRQSEWRSRRDRRGNPSEHLRM